MPKNFLIIVPEGRLARSVVRHGNGITACVYSRFSIDGWGDISDESSSEFSLNLCSRLLNDTGEAVIDNLRLTQATFAEIADRFKPSHPEWVTCEFISFHFTANSAKLCWVGEVHGVVKSNGITIANVEPHLADKKMPAGRPMGIVTNSLSFQENAYIETTSFEISPHSKDVFVWIGSKALDEIAENELFQKLTWSTHREMGTQEARASAGELQGIAFVFQDGNP